MTRCLNSIIAFVFVFVSLFNGYHSEVLSQFKLSLSFPSGDSFCLSGQSRPYTYGSWQIVTLDSTSSLNGRSLSLQAGYDTFFFGSYPPIPPIGQQSQSLNVFDGIKRYTISYLHGISSQTDTTTFNIVQTSSQPFVEVSATSVSGCSITPPGPPTSYFRLSMTTNGSNNPYISPYYSDSNNGVKFCYTGAWHLISGLDSVPAYHIDSFDESSKRRVGSVDHPVRLILPSNITVYPTSNPKLTPVDNSIPTPVTPKLDTLDLTWSVQYYIYYQVGEFGPGNTHPLNYVEEAGGGELFQFTPIPPRIEISPLPLSCTGFFDIEVDYSQKSLTVNLLIALNDLNASQSFKHDVIANIADQFKVNESVITPNILNFHVSQSSGNNRRLLSTNVLVTFDINKSIENVIDGGPAVIVSTLQFRVNTNQFSTNNSDAIIPVQLLGVTVTNIGAIGDPQFNGLLGQSFQIHGIAGGVYSIISEKCMQLNSRFDFLSHGTCPTYSNSNNKPVNCWSHPGSYFGSIGLTTAAGDQLLIEAGTGSEGFRLIALNNQSAFDNEVIEWPLMMKGFVRDIAVQGTKHCSEPLSLRIHDRHHLTVSYSLWSLDIDNSDRFVNIASVKVHDWSILNQVKPHGLLGQTWKAFKRNKHGQNIEGRTDDYLESTNNLFGHSTIYDKFNKS